ncbi:MAG: PQQ-binding-like beta-propeller repeat protein [Bryobacteraceae bacterium]
MTIALRTLAAIAILAVPLAAEDSGWRQFRGPDSNPVGSSPALPDQWSKTKNVEWDAPIPGRGWSSPIVSGGKVFVTTAVTDGKSKVPQTGTEYSNQLVAELQKQGLSMKEILAKVNERDIEMPDEVNLHYFLICLDLAKGNVLWKQEFHTGKPPGGRHRKNSFTSETPITDGELVYVYVANLGLYAYDMKGKQKWHTALEALPIYLDFGTGGSPVLHGNMLIILSDNEKQQFLAAYDKKSGKQIWRTNKSIKDPAAPRQSGWTTPYIWTNKLRTEIVTTSPGFAVSYDLEGKELWRLAGMSQVTVPSPFSHGDMLYVDGGQGRGLFAVRAGASGDISLPKDEKSNDFVAWSDPRAGTYLPTPVLYDGALYVLNEEGILSRIDAKTGKVSYKERLDVEGAYFTSSPWAYNGKVFCLSEEGKTYVVEAGETYKLLHVNPLEEMAQATPAIVGERLLVRTETHLYSIRAAK